MAKQALDAPKDGKREKKRGGLVARLIGGGGASGGSVANVGVGSFGGAAGEAGGLLGRLASSGILATKTGLLAVALVAASAAGGIVLVGYNLLNPGPVQPGDNLQLFASKPKDSTPEVAPVPEDGSSKSLSFLNEANQNPGSPEAPQDAPAEAPKDGAAASAAAATASDGGAGTGAAVAAGAGGNGVSKLLPNGKFGQLTNPGDLAKGAVTGAAAKQGAGAPAGAAAATASHLGTLSAMKTLASANGARSMSGRRFGSRGALGQAFGAMRDNRSATSSAAGGATYDGSAAAAGGNIGANGSTIGGPGGDATGPAEPKNVTNPAAVDPQLAPPPTPNATPMAPWQNAIKTAQMLIGLSVGLMLVAKLLAKTQYGKIAAMVIAAVVASIGGMVIALGAQIANGQYGQKLQGGVLAAAGVGLMVMAAATAFGGDSGAKNASGLNTAGTADADAAGADASAADSTGAASGGASGGSGGMFANINPFVLIGGGMSLIGLCGSMMVPPKTYPSKDFPNGNPPDTHFFGSRAPSESALKTMVS